MKTPYQKYQQRRVWKDRIVTFALGMIALAVVLGCVSP